MKLIFMSIARALVRTLVLALLGISSPSSAQCGPSVGFVTPQAYPQSNSSMHVVCGHYDTNDLLDFVVVDGLADKVTAFLQQPGGAFTPTPAILFPNGSEPRSIGTGDFNGDGDEDLLIVLHLTNQVTVLTGTGLGTFFIGSTYNVDTQPVDIAVGDLNGDNELDAAVASFNGTNVTLLFGDGSAQFPTSSTLPVGPSARAIAITDWNKDFAEDLLISFSGQLHLFTNAGGGSFPGSPVSVVFSDPGDIATADFDEDGWIDAAVESQHGVTLVLNDQTGGFGTLAFFPSLTSHTPESIQVGDVDGDGHVDVVVSTSTPDVAVLTGDGLGVLCPPSVFGLVSTQSRSVALCDLDNNCTLDVVVTDNSTTTPAVGVATNAVLPPLCLASPTPGIVAVVNTAIVSYATPGGLVALGFSSSTGKFDVGAPCPGLLLDLDNPSLVGTATASTGGVATFSGFVPASFSGTTVFLQAVDVSTCQATNLVSHTFP